MRALCARVALAREACDGADARTADAAIARALQAAAGVLTGPGITLMRFTGPGRVGIQSMFVDHGTG